MNLKSGVAHADAQLSASALDVLTKIAAIIPKHLREIVDDPVIGTPPSRQKKNDSGVNMGKLREWSRRGSKLFIQYVDDSGTASERTAWPILIGYVTGTRVLVAWCELRLDFRMFRTDRLESVAYLDERYLQRRASLRRQWLALMNEVATGT